MSIGWTNESHILYINSMEASFMQQFHGNELQAPYQNRGYAGGNEFKALQPQAADNLRSQRNDSCTRDEGIRGLPENPWIRHFKPRNSSIHCPGDRLGASSVDDGESGTDRLKNWKGRLLSRAGRLVLINSVITSSATYFLTSFSARKWAVKRIDKLRRNFLWSGDDEAHGGKCMVNWQTICAPGNKKPGLL